MTIGSTGSLFLGYYVPGRMEWFTNTLTTPSFFIRSQSTLAMGFDFSLISLLQGDLYHGSPLNGLTGDNLEITNGATASLTGGTSASLGSLSIGTSIGSGTFNLASGLLAAQYVATGSNGAFGSEMQLWRSMAVLRTKGSSMRAVTAARSA